MMILNIFHHQTGDQGSAHLSAWDTLGKASLHWPNHWSQPINFFNVVCTLLFCFAVCTLFFCLGIRLPKQNQKKTTLCLNQSWTSFFCVFCFFVFCGFFGYWFLCFLWYTIACVYGFKSCVYTVHIQVSTSGNKSLQEPESKPAKQLCQNTVIFVMTYCIILGQWISVRNFNFARLRHAQMIGLCLLLCCMSLQQVWTRGNGAFNF